MWQPIETAPKKYEFLNRENFILCLSDKRITIGYWDEDIYAKKPIPRWVSIASHFGAKGLILNPPTHWMPLPSPPEE